MYRIEFENSARKSLAKLDRPVATRITAAIAALAENPRPAGATQLVSESNAWRIRVGDYRVIYTIEDDVLTVWVIKVGHRREIYER